MAWKSRAHRVSFAAIGVLLLSVVGYRTNWSSIQYQQTNVSIKHEQSQNTRPTNATTFLASWNRSTESNDGTILPSHPTKQNPTLEIPSVLESHATRTTFGNKSQILEAASGPFGHSPIASNASHSDDTPTILVQLAGEMANNLGYLARGLGMAWWLEREFHVNATIVLRHQNHDKWIRAYQDVTRCFPNVRDWSFTAGNTDAVTRELQSSPPLIVTGSVVPQRRVVYALEPYNETLQSFLTLYNENHTRMAEGNGHVSIPFLTTKAMSCNDHILDKYYEDFRRIYRFDESCCIDRPDEDESVYHFRNFIGEMPKNTKRLGFEELAPDAVANQLFAHLHAGDKVAIASRFGEDFRTQMLVRAFARRGILARVLEPRSGVADFCFLLHAQKELVGTAQSTYFMWAGILGNARRVRAYSVRTPEGNNLVHNSNWTHPDLQRRFQFELYSVNSSATDLLNPNATLRTL